MKNECSGFVQASSLIKDSNQTLSNDSSRCSQKAVKGDRRKFPAQKNNLTNYFLITKTKSSKEKSDTVAVMEPKKELAQDNSKILFCSQPSTSRYVEPPSKKQCLDVQSASNCTDLTLNCLDLPTHILENILGRLPIIDMLRVIPVTCKRFREVVSNPKFMKWKKQYYKLKSCICAEELIIPDKFLKPQTDVRNCLPTLIRCIPEYCHHATPEIEIFLKSHRKYEWVIDMFNERRTIIDIPMAVNPWSIVAALVIISETVWDIYNIIRCLVRADCYSMHVIDSLYFIATILLYYNRTFSINLGLHYRTFYALYMYENYQKIGSEDLTLFNKSIPGQQTIYKYGQINELKLSHEQLRIVNHQLELQQVVKIIAFAGTGKTTTLVNYTQMRPGQNFLLIVYNKAVCEHAKKVFPKNVECRTAHSLAYRAVGHRFRSKLSFKIKPLDIINHLKEEKMSMHIYKRAKMVLRIIENFMGSADEDITLELVPSSIVIDQRVDLSESDRNILLRDARKLWSKMEDPEDYDARITHDCYLKIYQLSKPEITDYDCIMVDEAQDCNAAMLNIVGSQKCPKILVGDPHQQIYAFRGAVNAIASVNCTHMYYLTQSFRFGPEIAYVASCCLQLLKSESCKTLVGGSHSDYVDGTSKGQVAVIARTNVTLFNEAVRICCLEEGSKNVCGSFTSGINSYGLDQILDVYRLFRYSCGHLESKHLIRDKFISRFKSFNKLAIYAENAEDIDLMGKIRLVRQHLNKIPEYIETIKKRCSHPLKTASIVFSTAHKSKGLEFSTVHLTDDYFIGDVPYVKADRYKNIDEFNILYVAVTRAKMCLVMSNSAYYVLLGVSEKFEYPVCKKTSSEILKCCICSEDILSMKSLVMFKRTLMLNKNCRLKDGYVCMYCASSDHSIPEVNHSSYSVALVGNMLLPDFQNQSLASLVGPMPADPIREDS